MKTYKVELIGSDWWVVRHEPFTDGSQTLISHHAGEAAANRAAYNLNEAFDKGREQGLEEGYQNGIDAMTSGGL